jgi:hypothetical protein
MGSEHSVILVVPDGQFAHGRLLMEAADARGWRVLSGFAPRALLRAVHAAPVVAGVVAPRGADDGPAALRLAQLIRGAGARAIVVTVDYDEAVERAARAAGAFYHAGPAPLEQVDDTIARLSPQPHTRRVQRITGPPEKRGRFTIPSA